jgi:plastocyanin
MRNHRLVAIIAVPFIAAALSLVMPNCGDDNHGVGGAGGRGTGGVGVGGGGGSVGVGGGGGSVGVGGGGGTTADASAVDTLVAAAEISIQAFTWVPADLTVQPGATVTIHNNDTAPHTVTSQSVPRAFVPGGVQGISFDTGIIPPGGMATITIPATAPHGTVIPYFCSVHTSAMQNDGQIMVQ